MARMASGKTGTQGQVHFCHPERLTNMGRFGKSYAQHHGRVFRARVDRWSSVFCGSREEDPDVGRAVLRHRGRSFKEFGRGHCTDVRSRAAALWSSLASPGAFASVSGDVKEQFLFRATDQQELASIFACGAGSSGDISDGIRRTAGRRGSGRKRCQVHFLRSMRKEIRKKGVREHFRLMRYCSLTLLVTGQACAAQAGVPST